MTEEQCYLTTYNIYIKKYSMLNPDENDKIENFYETWITEEHPVNLIEKIDKKINLSKDKNECIEKLNISIILIERIDRSLFLELLSNEKIHNKYRICDMFNRN